MQCELDPGFEGFVKSADAVARQYEDALSDDKILERFLVPCHVRDTVSHKIEPFFASEIVAFDFEREQEPKLLIRRLPRAMASGPNSSSKGVRS